MLYQESQSISDDGRQLETDSLFQIIQINSKACLSWGKSNTFGTGFFRARQELFWRCLIRFLEDPFHFLYYFIIYHLSIPLA